MKRWKEIGLILIEKGILTPTSVARLISVSKKKKKRFGWILEDLGLVTGDELAGALAEQFGFKKVSNLLNRTFDQSVLNTVPAEFALEHLIFPLKLEEKNLILAVADPTDMKFINNFAVNNGFKIMPCVASRKDIYESICKHYFGRNVQESKKTTVLVVDDDALTQTVLRDILVKQGYHVVFACDGLEGFKEVITSKPQVIITDKVMPKLDGFAMMKAIKAIPELRPIPIILLSDKMTEKDEAKVFKSGFFDYVTKPIKEVTIISRVERALGVSDN